MSIVKDYIALPIDPLNFRIIVIGFILILFMLYRPEGIIPEEKTKFISTRLKENGAADDK
jgi:branched-chain amino acid transport system permease protein